MTGQDPSYTPTPITQRDGSALASSNCRCASISTGLDYETRGAKRSTGAKMRSHTSDQSGGTDSGDAREAWSRGYGEELSVRDGYTWPDALADLRAGRAVHLDVWHATVGSQVCLSGSGSYGHTMYVHPDQHSDGLRWRVADPWCSPASWKWVDESRLRAGAEEWSRRVYGTAVQEADYPTSGVGDPRDPRALLVVARIVRRLMSEHRPGLPDDDDEGVPTPVGWDTGGAPPILYTRTRALPLEEDDMGFAIRYPGGGRYGMVSVPAGVEVYRVSDSELVTVGAGGSSGPGCSAIHDVAGGSPGFAYTSAASGTTYWVRATDATMDDGGGGGEGEGETEEEAYGRGRSDEYEHWMIELGIPPEPGAR